MSDQGEAPSHAAAFAMQRAHCKAMWTRLARASGTPCEQHAGIMHGIEDSTCLHAGTGRQAGRGSVRIARSSAVRASHVSVQQALLKALGSPE